MFDVQNSHANVWWLKLSCSARCDTAVQARCLLKCQAWKCQQYLSIVPQHTRQSISFKQFTDCICGPPPVRVNAKSLCFRVLSRFFFSLNLQNWMLSLCSLLSLVSDHQPPKREIEGLPIGTNWWWNVKNAEYLILTFVMCPKPDISMSTKMLFWLSAQRVVRSFWTQGRVGANRAIKILKCLNLGGNLAHSYLLIYGVSWAAISATNQTRSILGRGQRSRWNLTDSIL